MNPLSSIFGAVAGARNALYDHGVLRSRRLSSPVISVGNLSAGGTGKTPFTIAMGELLQARGIEFDVLSRGYRRQSKGVLFVDPVGDVAMYGDEPVMIATRLGVPVVVGEERFLAGRAAEAKFPGRLHLLDDGFQHRQLARDFDIVLLAAGDECDTLLPVGRLREPLASLSRADAVVIPEEMRCALPVEESKVWRVRRRLVLPEPRPLHPVAFCGIAKPEPFFEQLRAHGVAAAAEIRFADHHAFSLRDVAKLKKTAQEYGADGFICTEKDAVKLRNFSQLEPLAVVRLVMEIVDGEAAVDQMLRRLQLCPKPA